MMDSYYCKICNVACSGFEPYQQHIRGAPHLRRARGETGSQYYCQACNVSLSGENARLQHEAGAPHQRSLTRIAATASSPEATMTLMKSLSSVPSTPRTLTAVDLIPQHQQPLDVIVDTARRMVNISQPIPISSTPPSSYLASRGGAHHQMEDTDDTKKKNSINNDNTNNNTRKRPRSETSHSDEDSDNGGGNKGSATSVPVPSSSHVIVIRQLERLKKDILEGALGNPETLELEFSYTFDDQNEVAVMKVVKRAD